jgi:phosphohistidine swiveling domain-containing protein
MGNGKREILHHPIKTNYDIINKLNGTKIATKVLKDGDLVEVDAQKGVVRIIKKKA